MLFRLWVNCRSSTNFHEINYIPKKSPFFVGVWVMTLCTLVDDYQLRNALGLFITLNKKLT
jgi:hypothetical protein